jgi:hypothetical protein
MSTSGAAIIAEACKSPPTVGAASGFAASWISSIGSASPEKAPKEAPNPSGMMTAASRPPLRTVLRARSRVYGAGLGLSSVGFGAVTTRKADWSSIASTKRRLTSLPS